MSPEHTEGGETNSVDAETEKHTVSRSGQSSDGRLDERNQGHSRAIPLAGIGENDGREEVSKRRTYLKGIAFTGFGAGALAGFPGFSKATSNTPNESRLLEETGSEAVQIASTSRDCYYYTIRQGTPEATHVYVIRSGNPGPTGFVIGGVHGDEPSGYIVASYIRRRWDVEQGTLVVLPRANEVAIDQGTREYYEGDLNRKYPIGGEPTTALARAIWEVVLRHDPDIVIDAHSSRGIYQSSTSRCPEAVGQSIRPSPGQASTQRAIDTIEDLNQNYVPDSLPDDYYFDLRTPWYGDGRLLEKLHVDLGIPNFTTEVTRCGLDLYTQRVPWTRVMIRDLLEQYGLFRIELPEIGHCNSLPGYLLEPSLGSNRLPIRGLTITLLPNLTGSSSQNRSRSTAGNPATSGSGT